MDNENCKGCLVYETMPNKVKIKCMVAFCGLSRSSICPCFCCLVKPMCEVSCARFKEWRVKHPHLTFAKYMDPTSTKHMGRFF